MNRASPNHDAETAATPLPGTNAAPVYRCFLFTDIEGSVGLWERHGERFREVLDVHHATIREVLQKHGGRELVEAGDGFLICFEEPEAAAKCAAAAQNALARITWPVTIEPLRVRMGLHAGHVEPRENGEFRGIVISRAARVRDTAHGGQVICSYEVTRALSDGISARELGRFRLKGVPAPERLFELRWDGMGNRSFPPPNAVPAYTHNLPQSPTRFVGRSQQIETLRKTLLASDNSRLLTLTGPGGTGKTRLAVAVAESVLEEFSHAVFFVPLAEVEDPSLIMRHVAEALRLDLEGGIRPEDQIVQFLGTEPALLVFDNFERLTAGGAIILRQLIQRVPKLRVLVTSRNRIHLLGEREFPVPPLSLPDKMASLDELREAESVLLFSDRAQSARPGFEVSERNAPAIGELCRRLDGVPLAIELAAARSDVMTAQEVLQSLSDRLNVLEAGDNVPARHRSLRAAIDWSFEFLPPALREFFTNLSVFRGGWTAQAAEAISATAGLGQVSANVLRALSELRAASLIVTEEAGDAMRFRMLETLRQYAEERFAALEDPGAIISRHRLYYLAMAEEAEPKLLGSEQKAWMEKLEIEHDNLRVLLNDTYPNDTGLRVAGSLAQFWMVRGYFREGRELIQRQLERKVESAPIIRLTAVNGAGMLAWAEGDMAEARRYFEEALQMSRELDDPKNVAGMLNNLGIVAFRQDDLDSAERYMLEALPIYAGIEKEMQRRGMLLANLAAVLNEKHEFERGKEYALKAISIFEPMGDIANLQSAFATLGQAEGGLGSLQLAKELQLRALTIATDLADLRGVANIWDGLSELALWSGEYEEASRLSYSASHVAEKLGIRDWGESRARKERSIDLAVDVEPERLLALRREGEAYAQEYLRKHRLSGKY